MALDRVAQDGLVLLGCGKMGSALLAGWLKAGVPAASVWVIEPNPSEWLKSIGVHLNEGVPAAPAVALLAVKPQMNRGITALCRNAHVPDADMELAVALMAAVGETVILEGEHQIDAVTAVSGSGPAYVFHLIEAMAAAGEAEGLAPDVAMKLARATVSGAGELAHRSGESAAQLRINVTSPGGTTAAALAVLMPELPGLMVRAVKAAADRGRELGK